jgi:hypothetical protein
MEQVLSNFGSKISQQHMFTVIGRVIDEHGQVSLNLYIEEFEVRYYDVLFNIETHLFLNYYFSK